MRHYQSETSTYTAWFFVLSATVRRWVGGPWVLRVVGARNYRLEECHGPPIPSSLPSLSARTSWSTGRTVWGWARSPGLVGRDKSTVSREIRPNGWYSPVAGRMWCYRTRAPPTTRASAGRGGAAASPCWPIPGAWSWWPGLVRESAPAPPGADRGPHHDPGAPTWGAGDTTILQGGPQRPGGPHARRAQQG